MCVWAQVCDLFDVLISSEDFINWMIFCLLAMTPPHYISLLLGLV